MENIEKVGLWDGIRHIIIGGVGGSCAAYQVKKGEIVYLDVDKYNSLHPEADTAVFYSLKTLLEHHSAEVIGSTVIIDCPETDCVNVVLHKYASIKSLLDTHQIKLYCKLHDQLIEKATGKKAKASQKRKTIDEQSVTTEEFFLDFQTLGQLIREDASYQSLQFPHESLGALSILTGNDKIPAFRSCTKKLALTQFRKQCEEGNMADIVNLENKKFDESEHCIKTYRTIIFIMYYHLYRTTIHKLGLTWESFVILSSGELNLELLREVGVRHCKGKEFNFVPVEPVINPARKRVFYQTSEYDQIFEKEPTYMDPLTCGYSKLGSFLTPTLNEQIVNVVAQPNVVEPVETVVTDGNGEQLELEEEPDSVETESDNEVTNDEAANTMEADDDDDIGENECEEERSADQTASYSDADMDEDDSYHHQNPFILWCCVP